MTAAAQHFIGPILHIRPHANAGALMNPACAGARAAVTVGKKPCIQAEEEKHLKKVKGS